jgi:hypothetical protein
MKARRTRACVFVLAPLLAGFGKLSFLESKVFEKLRNKNESILFGVNCSSVTPA